MRAKAVSSSRHRNDSLHGQWFWQSYYRSKVESYSLWVDSWIHSASRLLHLEDRDWWFFLTWCKVKGRIFYWSGIQQVRMNIFWLTDNSCPAAIIICSFTISIRDKFCHGPLYFEPECSLHEVPRFPFIVKKLDVPSIFIITDSAAWQPQIRFGLELSLLIAMDGDSSEDFGCFWREQPHHPNEPHVQIGQPRFELNRRAG